MLSDEILRQVNRPARYTGGEWNSIVKGWDRARIKIALAYPDTYEIGMSNLAIPILYEILNSREDVLAERVYAPWTDMEAQLRRHKLPLFSLESKRPLRDFDIIGFSLGYELTYTNVLSMLDLAGIPPLASRRDGSHPLIIAGGSCTLNPEPLADFIDAFVIGDGEEVVHEFLDTCLEGKGMERPRLLRSLARISGVYVPSLYQAEYFSDGRLKSLTPTAPEAPTSIKRRIIFRLPPPVTRPVVPYIEVIHDRGAIEIQRGCSRGCRFCQAGMIYRPVRRRPPGQIIQAVGDLVTNCGYDEVSLVSLNTSDYTGIGDLVAVLTRRFPKLTLSLPSLRLDKSSIRLVESLPTHRRSGLTFAPEAGSERLRRAINKELAETSLLETATTAFQRGWTGLKLYFMVGLPTETSEDVQSIVELVEKLRSQGGRPGGQRPMLRLSIATFVPKPHTPFQWVGQESEAVLRSRQEILQKGLSRRGISLSWQNPETSLLEAILSRGDRRLGAVIHRAWELGARFDAWSDHFRMDIWKQAFASTGLDPSFYAHRQRDIDELLPWSHIDSGISVTFLKREFQRTTEGKETPDCQSGPCQACGLENTDICLQKVSPGKTSH